MTTTRHKKRCKRAPPGCAGSRKEAIVAAYLRPFIDESPRPAAGQQARKDLDARARLRAVFLVEPTSRPDGVVRGCPFHNTAVEAAGTTPEVAELVEQHEREFTRRPAEVAAEAGARDPEPWPANWPCSTKALAPPRPRSTTPSRPMTPTNSRKR
ncbi:hypothetical protein AB0E25_26970 [Streptomyces bobili]|uniref:hypothetical protein n=1 Tax=Streptomyces bobili TaxID=67280 RepID=UPI0033F01774